MTGADYVSLAFRSQLFSKVSHEMPPADKVKIPLHEIAGSVSMTPASAAALALILGGPTAIAAGAGALTSPRGRRLHGAASTVGRMQGITTGTALGGAAGGLTGLLADAALNNGQRSSSAGNAGLVGTALGAGLGGYAGHWLSRETQPGPRELGLGDVEDRTKKYTAYTV